MELERYWHHAAMKGPKLQYDKRKVPSEACLVFFGSTGENKQTLSANTKKMPKSSSMAHCVTIFRCRTRRIAGGYSALNLENPTNIYSHFGSCLNPIHTPSVHPIATRARPSGVSSSRIRTSPKGLWMMTH